MNTRIKGNRSVRRAIEYYTKEGWVVDKVEKVGKWILIKDLYGLFDLVGVKNNRTVFIQVKTNLFPKKDLYFEFAKKFGGKNLFVESYTWFDNKGEVVYRYLPERYTHIMCDARWERKLVTKRKK
jgi:hypothetical protein